MDIETLMKLTGDDSGYTRRKTEEVKLVDDKKQFKIFVGHFLEDLIKEGYRPIGLPVIVQNKWYNSIKSENLEKELKNKLKLETFRMKKVGEPRDFEFDSIAVYQHGELNQDYSIVVGLKYKN